MAWCAAAAALLLIGNVLVAVHHLGTGAGRTYRWVCRETGAQLSYNPSVFGGPERASLVGRGAAGGRRWELVEPRLSLWLPWNWLAACLDRTAPDPDAVLRQEHIDLE